ncbi:MAG: menaquinone biosynthesis protein [Desulfamplus sp.]|nr:menaquinone biosynthesis protein [Desulfamplus sp.]
MGKIDYINAFPVYYGLDHGMLPDWIEMVSGPPSILNGMIQSHELHLSPVSAAFYAVNHRELLIMPDLSISCHGEVLSVVLMTNHPVEELAGRKVLLTRDSATAAALVRLVMKMNIEPGSDAPEFSTGRVREISDVPGDADAALIIGDAAMTQPWEKRFRFRIDLGDMWHRMTGMPFVFAVWVIHRRDVDDFGLELHDALKILHASRVKGYENIDRIITSGAERLNLDTSYIRRYFDLLHCNLDRTKIKALEHFTRLLHDQGLLNEPVSVELFPSP